MDCASDDARVKRLRRLASELSDEQIELVEDWHVRVGGHIEERRQQEEDRREPLTELLLDELLYALRTPVHEGKRASYGSFVVTDISASTGLTSIATMIPLRSAPELDRVRELANGVFTFVVRDLTGAIDLCAVQASSEAEIMSLAQEVSLDVVQRHPNGTVRVFGRERLLIFENDEWRVKPYAHTRWLPVAHHAGIEGRLDVRIPARLLDLSLHTLSARHDGATFVLMLDGTTSDLASGLSTQPRQLPAELNIERDADAQALTTLLAHLDGACLIEADGEVAGVEAMFAPTSKANDLVSVKGGSRHNSAARFSFDYPAALVIVVSADGPVTVFSDGRSILTLDPHAYYAAERLRRSVPAKSEDIEDWDTRVTCERCGKRLLIHVMVIIGWKDRESVDCPVCGQEAVFSKMCWSLSAEVLKPWQ